jgi:hypothetical protein
MFALFNVQYFALDDVDSLPSLFLALNEVPMATFYLTTIARPYFLCRLSGTK